MKLNRVIQKLLANNNFISLPSIGSFVQTLEPATLLADGVTFIQPKQTIVFSASRTFNDGLLERYLRETEAITASEASVLVKQYINKLKEEIEKGVSITFENVGTLQKKDDGALFFEPFPVTQRISATFGLQSIKLEPSKEGYHPPHKQPELQSVKPKQTTSSNNFAAVGLPIMLGVAAVVVLMLVGSLLIFVPELRVWSSVSNKNIDLTTIQHESQPSFTNALPLDTLNQVQSDTATSELEGNVEIITDKKRALFYEEPIKPEDKTYYIVAGSFEQIDNAQQLFESLSKEGYTPELLQSNGYYRVAISKFSDKNRALRELARFRSQKPTESVWILGL
ncbi:MAG: SPOR domain-containing protein [Tenuifilaceae bacterium]|nr:SPOR domain-containing protein [Tenuifilaceae bacterium]